MKNFAEIKNGKVSKVIVSEENPDASVYVEYDESNPAGIGYSFDEIKSIFISPTPECGHEDLILNDLNRWECASCDAEFIKRLASLKAES